MDPSIQSKPVKTILSLSDEVLLNIFQNLEMCDMVPLSETCQRFQRILCDRTICQNQNLWIPWNVGTSRESTISFIEQRSSIITSLTLTNIRWIPSDLIQRIVLNLPLLKGLHVAGLRFSWAHLHEVLKSPLPILDKLSWTYDIKLEESIINQIKKKNSKTVKSNKVYNELLLLREKFQQFKYLLFHVKDSIPITSNQKNFIGISYIVSLCTNIEEFWLIGNLQFNYSFDCDTVNELLLDVDFFKLKFPNLHTLVVTLASDRRHLPEIFHYLMVAFYMNNVRNAKDDSKSSAMKLWMDPCLSRAALHRGPGFNFSSLSWFSCGTLRRDLENINLSQLKKLAFDGFVNSMQIQKFLEHAPNLESFTYHLDTTIDLDWFQIAVNNTKLKEVTVLGAGVTTTGYQKFAESCADIAKLPLIQKISLPLACLFQITAPEIIIQYNSDKKLAEILRLQEEGAMHRTPDVSPNASQQNQHQRPTGLDCLTLNCRNVKEFKLSQKIGLAYENGVGFGNIDVVLSNISRWGLLEYLTLCNVYLIDDGEFLIKIAESCKLKSLRLVHLGRPNAKCCTFTECLYMALKLMPHLKDFRVEQNYIGSVTPLFEALQSCHKLQRLAIFVNENFNSAPLEASEPLILKLMNTSRNLYLFYLSLSSASEASCESLTKRIIKQFKSSRPALNVLIKNTRITDREAMLFNYVHHCDLMQCENESCFKLYDSY